MALQAKILEASETTGREFSVPSGERVQIAVEDHAGGTITLQYKSLKGTNTWQDITGDGGVTFTDDGVKTFWSSPALTYRLSGGTVGAQAWLLSTEPIVRGNLDVS